MASLAPYLLSSAGGGLNVQRAAKAIRLARYGCTNRPFYHIVVMMKGRNQHEQPIEQVGTWDPLPNQFNEQLVGLNFERLQYWIGEGAEVTTPVGELLGLSGFLPIHPRTYLRASRWRNRDKLKEAEEPKPEEK